MQRREQHGFFFTLKNYYFFRQPSPLVVCVRENKKNKFLFISNNDLLMYACIRLISISKEGT
jgi:hypothetical protein